MTVSSEESIQSGCAGGGRDLHQVARLLVRRIRAHRPLDERALRHRREEAAKSLMGGRRGRKQEANRRAELHVDDLSGMLSAGQGRPMIGVLLSAARGRVVRAWPTTVPW